MWLSGWTHHTLSTYRNRLHHWNEWLFLIYLCCKRGTPLIAGLFAVQSGRQKNKRLQACPPTKRIFAFRECLGSIQNALEGRLCFQRWSTGLTFTDSSRVCSQRFSPGTACISHAALLRQQPTDVANVQSLVLLKHVCLRFVSLSPLPEPAC